MPLRCIQPPKIPNPQGNIGLTARATMDYKYNALYNKLQQLKPIF